MEFSDLGSILYMRFVSKAFLAWNRSSSYGNAYVYIRASNNCMIKRHKVHRANYSV